MRTLSSSSDPFDLEDAFTGKVARQLYPWLASPLGTLTGTRRLRQLYAARRPSQTPAEFARVALEQLAVSYTVAPADRLAIPAQGPLVIVANHPYGAVEGLLLADLLSGIRPDAKFLANELLQRFPEFREMIIPVDVFSGDHAVHRNLAGLRRSVRWVQDGHALMIFPAGEVAHLRVHERCVCDPEWQPTIGRLIRLTKATVVPVFFPGHNSALFQLAGLLHARLRTVMLPRQLLRCCGRRFEVRVGQPIGPDVLERFPDAQRTTAFLRFRTHLLAVRAPGSRPVAPPPARVPIGAPEAPAALADEIAALPAERLLTQQKEFAVYCAGPAEIPHVLRELGRLREVSFRACGEGTGKEMDLDRFDQTYRHLFIWDHTARVIVGAYRLAPAQEALARHGAAQLYLHQLFHIQPEFFRHLPPALELGRSFVQPAYQRHPAALFLLWRGIGQYLVRHPRYRALIGPVSISNDYQPLAQQLLVQYLRASHWAADCARWVEARQPFRPQRWPEQDPSPFLDHATDIAELDRWLAVIEGRDRGMPVLLRQYLKLGGRIACFNRDPDFANALDALLVVRFSADDARVLGKYMGKEGTASYLAFNVPSGATAAARVTAALPAAAGVLTADRGRPRLRIGAEP